MKKFGKIIVSADAKPTEKELAVARTLVQSGHDVEFIPEGILHTPDIIYAGKNWEIKRPEGNGKRTMMHQAQRAILQSDNIIIDTSGTTMKLADIKAQFKKICKDNKAIKHMMLVTKNGEILTIK